jgi:ribonucleoside-diphosphate reductase alpha chain
MDISQKVLSDIVVFQKYSKYIPEIYRRETWEEICQRNMAMHIRKYPAMKEEIKSVYKEFVIPRKVLPSMRSMQFGGEPIEVSNSRIFNCAFSGVDNTDVFPETMFNLLSGSGVGYSLVSEHIGKLPYVKGTTTKTRRFLIGDSISGWADAIKVLFKAHFYGKSNPIFDYRDIRPKGARLITSGGKAPGPEPLRICIEKIRGILEGARGRRLKSIEIHDCKCHISDAVLSGGIRRAATIALFEIDDLDMLYCKTGDWWELNPQRGRANNSVLLNRNTVTKEQWDKVWEVVRNSGSGEPGFVWTEDMTNGTNPCGEIGLKSKQYCNLTEVNVSDISCQEELNRRVRAASFIGTLQAGYTDFHYLSDDWKDNTEEESLIGVGMTGIASGGVMSLDLTEAANAVVEENKRVSSMIGINTAARCTTIKPSGSTSCVVGSSSGIHSWHSEYYIRRVRVGKAEPLYQYLIDNIPELVEDCVFKPHIEAVLSIPQKAPDGAITRSESVIDLLTRVKKFNNEWVRPGHISGIPTHNVSCTISVKDDEWDMVGEWMWENRNNYTGISVLPFSDHTYKQAPFEDCDKETFDRMFALLKDIDLSRVIEKDDNTELMENVACAGGACEMK